MSSQVESAQYHLHQLLLCTTCTLVGLLNELCSKREKGRTLLWRVQLQHTLTIHHYPKP